MKLSEAISFSKKEKIKKWLLAHGADMEWTVIDDNYEITVYANCDLSGVWGRKLVNELPDFIKFNVVVKNFSVALNKLKSMKGFPKLVNGNFDISGNDFSSLEGCPILGDGCHTILLTSNNLKSLKGLNFKNKKLELLDVKYNFLDNSCFEYIPSHVDHLDISGNKIKSLKGIHKHVKQCKYFYCNEVPAPSNVLGLFFIEGLDYISIDNGGQISAIINKNLREGDMHICQEELIEAGYVSQARL